MPVQEKRQEQSTPRTLIPPMIAAWSTYLATDFLSHAVVFAPWWRWTQSYWLLPAQLFRRIPFGYASFALYCAALTWLIHRHFKERLSLLLGFRYGAFAGAIYGSAFVLAAFSVFSMPASALVVWPLTTVIGSAAAGAAAASLLRARRPWRRLLLVLALTVALVILGVVLQNLVVPAPSIGSVE